MRMLVFESTSLERVRWNICIMRKHTHTHTHTQCCPNSSGYVRKRSEQKAPTTEGEGLTEGGGWNVRDGVANFLNSLRHSLLDMGTERTNEMHYKMTFGDMSRSVHTC